MNFKKQKIIPLIFILAGLFLLLLNPINSITGNVVGSYTEAGFSALGFIFVLIGILLLSSRDDLNIVWSVKEDDRLYGLAKKLKGKETIQKDINHLLKELNKGNTNAGKGAKKLLGNISYMRGQEGGRVFYRPSGNKYEILAYAEGTGQGAGKSQHERRVISRLRDLYDK